MSKRGESEVFHHATLRQCLDPQSIAIIGASQNIIGARLVGYNLRHGYQGKVYAINPKYTELHGAPCYPTLASIPAPVDLAIIALPASKVLGALQDCVAKGVKAAIIISSGFAEVGDEGRLEQERISSLARETGLLVLGPNCQGIANLSSRVFANFSSGFDLPTERLKPGSVGFVSQSGAFAGMMVPMALDAGFGFSHWISTGNEADVQFADCVEFLATDTATRVIGGYVEGIRDGAHLMRACRLALSKGKPVVVTKTGRSQFGARAAKSHTGALVGVDEVYDAAFKQMGAIRALDTEELLDYLDVFSLGARLRGNRVAIVGVSGGIGSLMADMCADKGLEVPRLSDSTIAELQTFLPSYAAVANPVDPGVLMQRPETLGQCLQLLVDDPQIDGVLVLLGIMTVHMETFVRDITKVKQGTDKPILVTWMSAGSLEAVTQLHQNGVPAFDEPRRAVCAMGALAQYERATRDMKEPDESAVDESLSVPDTLRDKAGIEHFCSALIPGRKQGSSLTEYESKCILGELGLPVVRGALCKSSAQAAQAADELGYPVVLKIQSPDLPHKSEHGGVMVGLDTREDVIKGFDELLSRVHAIRPRVDMYGILVERLAKPGHETIVGLSDDPSFGMVVMFGYGGIFVEVFRDVARRVAPVTTKEASRMIAETRASVVLQGARGGIKGDVQSLAETIARVSSVGAALRGVIKELDINPLVVGEEGVQVVDALIGLR